MPSPLIMLEFNELSPTLMDRFIAAGQLPGFAELKRRSIVYTTDAEEAPPYLEPWIQWVTVHTGLPFATHGVFDLNDGPRCKHPRIWDRLSRSGLSSWICGSMNIGPATEASDLLLLPDPWATGVAPNPSGLFNPYYRFVSRYVQEYAAKDAPVSATESLAFASFMLSHGLSASTISQIIRQLAGERTGDTHWKRAVILDRLQWDVFRCFYRRRHPDFSTFFLNSTAHFQHYHWRDMEPEQFRLAPDANGSASYAQAILFGYKRMDRLVSECLQLAPEATVVLCTALSQQPLTAYDAAGGKQVFKAKDVEALLGLADVEPGWTYAPVMAEEFKLHFPSEMAAQAASDRLDRLRGPGATALMRVRRSVETLFLGCAITQTPAPGAVITVEGSAAKARFIDLFSPLEGVKSGAHHPDGILWWALPGGAEVQVAPRISLEAIAPTVLALLGTPASDLRAPLPEVMAALGRSGRHDLAA